MRLGAAAGLLIAMVAAALGIASQGKAATAISVTLTPLIGTTSNEVEQVTYGGKIGLHLEVANTGNSTANHMVIVVQASTATFSDASRSECAKDSTDSTKMVCKLRQMASGATPFTVDLRFTAPSSGSVVVATPSVTIDAQTQGGPGSKGTTTTTGAPVTTALVSSAANSLVKTFAKGKETVATSAALLQHSTFVLPSTLLGGAYGVETSVQETTGTPLCDKCPAFVTDLSIPASLTSSSPFSSTNPFSFTVTLEPAGWPSGYQPAGLFHDGVLVPMCADSPLGPTTHICLTGFTAKKSKGAVATGIADQNGRIGFG
ncbi:MAG TPA: hypothetical protein VFA66_04985 [Gaiellaceae bacterium]|nr:hypothetical protein [Gaiellaceae bacterium]